MLVRTQAPRGTLFISPPRLRLQPPSFSPITTSLAPTFHTLLHFFYFFPLSLSDCFLGGFFPSMFLLFGRSCAAYFSISLVLSLPPLPLLLLQPSSLLSQLYSFFFPPVNASSFRLGLGEGTLTCGGGGAAFAPSQEYNGS